jgi:phage terminase large subunit-like protein
MRWMVDNVVTRMDPAGNVKPDKGRSTEKIDGVVAAVMALDRATRHEVFRSKYEDDDLMMTGDL